MKDALEMLQDVSDLLIANNVRDFINGDVCILSSLNNSKKEDIVLNGIGLTSRQLQDGVFNINFHCPNLVLTIEGTEEVDNSQPNLERLMFVSKKIIKIVNDARGSDFWLTVLTPAMPIQDDNGSWFTNTRVYYNSIIKNFK